MSKRMLTDKVAALQIVALSVLMLLGLASTAGAQVRGPDEVVDLIATVFVNWEITRDERAPEKLVRSRKIMVVTRREGGWKIGWGQNTRFADSVPDAPACSKQ